MATKFRFRKCLYGRIHQGWYVDNIRDSSGVVACLRRDTIDGNWRIDNDPQFSTFKTRAEAAQAAANLLGVYDG
ncbi:hypothetical protein GOC13_07360 [Sinorhizobium meliloti]|nr:hypothetical protein [Sinorhizobium meliloti]